MQRTKPPGTNGEPTAKQDPRKRLQVLTEIVGSLVSRVNMFSQLGQQYGGDRDIYEALGYDIDITYNMLATRYSRQDIARAVINRPVEFTWKGPLMITEAGDEEDTKLEKAWRQMERELHVKSKLARLDKLSCIGQYGVLLLGFDDVVDKDGFRKEVSKGRKLMYLKPLGQGHADIENWVTDPRDSRYGLPNEYHLTYTNPGGNSTTDIYVHHTRVIHVVPEVLESEIEGDPVLQPIWNRLMDLEKLVGGSAEMYWRGARPGYDAALDKEYDLTADEEDELEEQLDEFEHNLRRILVTKGYDLKALQQQVSDPSNAVDVCLKMIAAETGIPKRILEGSERGELSSTQDLTSWYSVIQTRREEYAEPTIVREFVDRMIKYGVLPEAKDKQEGYQVEWHDLFATSEKEKAEVGKIISTAIKEYATNPAAQDIVPPEAFYELVLKLDPEQIDKLNEQIQKYGMESIQEELKSIREEKAAIEEQKRQQQIGTPPGQELPEEE